MSIGISKRELLENYYPGELEHIFGEYNIIHRSQEDTVEEKRVDALGFLGMGGA